MSSSSAPRMDALWLRSVECTAVKVARTVKLPERFTVPHVLEATSTESVIVVVSLYVAWPPEPSPTYIYHKIKKRVTMEKKKKDKKRRGKHRYQTKGECVANKKDECGGR